jgi:ABC-type dipeptide/oligopeptide/nickel transport system permease component
VLALLIRRTLLGVLTLIVTLILVFAMVRLLPGNPAAVLLRDDATPEQVAYISELWGLDKPIPVQFVIYLGNLLRGDAGDSYQYQSTAGSPGTPAIGLVLSRVPATIQLAVVSVLMSIVVAVPLGILTAVWRDSWLDHATVTSTLLLGSLPNFWIGMQLILFFGVVHRLLPTSGSGTPQHIILPAITLALPFMVILLRLTRTEVARVLQAEYITTARSKGLPPRTVLVRHALRNAMIPLVTIMGLRLGGLLNGAVVVETLFGWPGLGRLMIEAIEARDYPLIQVIVPLSAVIFVIVNVSVDIMYGLLDPRVKVGAS